MSEEAVPTDPMRDGGTWMSVIAEGVGEAHEFASF